MKTEKDSNVHAAVTAYFTWKTSVNSWMDKTTGEKLAQKVHELASDLCRFPMTLHIHKYQYEFNFTYGVKQDAEKYVPIKMEEAEILNAQHVNVTWPLYDPNTDSYFVPKLSKEDAVHDQTQDHGLTSSNDVSYLLNNASKDKTAYNILDAILSSHACFITQTVGLANRAKIRQIFPDKLAYQAKQ